MNISQSWSYPKTHPKGKPIFFVNGKRVSLKRGFELTLDGKLGEAHFPMPIVVQYPQSNSHWPYTFQGCHPIKEWRKPTDEELTQANHYYEIET